MKKIFSFVSLVLLSVLFFVSCEKELSFEGGGIVGPGAAVFTLGGSPASCTGFAASGTYMAGIALTTTNTITFDVNVSSAGAYTISTAAVNGITFSNTGSFTDTGTQTITLTGNGTPAAAGDFTYTVTNSAGNCSFIITTAPAAPPASGTLDCAGIAPAGTYTQGIALSSSNTISIPVTVTTAGSYSITTGTVNGCAFSSSGVLAAGAQTIILTGSGTPTASGNNSYNISFGTSSCSFSIGFLPGAAPSTDYLRCNIDGTAATFNVNLTGIAPMASAFAIDGSQSTDIPGPSLSLTLTNATGSVTAGTYNLLSLTNPTPIFCFPIYDDGTVTWSQGTNGQTGTFTIIVSQKTSNRITGTFSGTLYGDDGASTTAKVFTNGEFSVPY